MKRTVALILCALMILSFSGCVPSNNTSRQDSSEYFEANSSEQANSEYIQADSSEQTSSGYIKANSSQQTSGGYVQASSSQQTSSKQVQNNNTSAQTSANQKGDIYRTETYSFPIPESWRGKYMTVSGTNYTDFISTANHKNEFENGLLFSICWTNEENSWTHISNHKYLGCADGTYYYMYLPSCVTFVQDNHALIEEFQDMKKEQDNIIASFKLYGTNVSYKEPDENEYQYLTKQYSFSLPESWRGSFQTSSFRSNSYFFNETAFYSYSGNKEIASQGWLLSIVSTGVSDWKYYKYKYLGCADRIYYYAILAPEVQSADSNSPYTEQYLKMQKDIDKILASFKLYGNKVSYDKPN